MKVYRFVLLVACASSALPVLATARADDEAPPVKEASELIPLAVGNLWEYRRFHYGEDGTPVGETKEQTTVSRASDFSAGRYFLVETGNYREWLANSKEGVVRRVTVSDAAGSSSEDVRPVMLYRFPAKAGLKYTSKFDSRGKPAEETTIRELAEEVETPTGTYKCIVYERRDLANGRRIDEKYVAPGVGVVQHVLYNPDSGGLLSIAELVKFQSKDNVGAEK